LRNETPAEEVSTQEDERAPPSVQMQCTGPIRNPEVSQVSREPRPQNNTVTRGKGWGKQRKSRRRRRACAVILFLARSVSIQKALYR